MFNERGAVLVGARVWERVMPGVAYVDHGARADFIVPGELDRGGAINTITPHNITSKNCAGMVVSGFLVEVAARRPGGSEARAIRRRSANRIPRRSGLTLREGLGDDGARPSEGTAMDDSTERP